MLLWAHLCPCSIGSYAWLSVCMSIAKTKVLENSISQERFDIHIWSCGSRLAYCKTQGIARWAHINVKLLHLCYLLSFEMNVIVFVRVNQELSYVVQLLRNLFLVCQTKSPAGLQSSAGHFVPLSDILLS